MRSNVGCWISDGRDLRVVVGLQRRGERERRGEERRRDAVVADALRTLDLTWEGRGEEAEEEAEEAQVRARRARWMQRSPVRCSAS